jgi:hypothetical protein
MDLSRSTKDREPTPGDALLDRRERRILLEEIGRVALAIGRALYPRQLANEFGEVGAEAASDAGHLSPRERLAFLEGHARVVETALTLIARQPRAAVQAVEKSVSLDLARRPTPPAVMRSLRTGNLRPAPQGHALQPWASDLKGLLPDRIVDGARVESFDTRENRWVAATLAAWRADLWQIARLADWQEEPDLQARALGLYARYGRLLDETFLENLPTGAAVRPTQALLHDARYRALHDIERQYRRRLGFAWSLPPLRLPARDAWLLYEMWCFFRVAEALRSAGWEAVAGDAVRLTTRGLGLSMVKGQASRILLRKERQELSLYYNRAFPSAAVGSAQAHSRTYTLIPDISLELGGRFLLLDPKYRSYSDRGAEQEDVAKIQVTDYEAVRTNQALLADVLKMHAYRDAIHAGDRQVVDAAWCLFPGTANSGTQIIAYPHSTPEEPFGRAAVGAIRLRPGEDNSALVRLIASWSAV